MLFIVANTQDAALAHQLAARIATEDSDEDSLYTLLIGLWDSRVRLSAHLDQVLANIDDPREMVRCAAIRLVRSYDDGLDVAEAALVEVVKAAYGAWDLRHAAETLGMIGGFNVLGSLFFGWAGGRWNKQALLGGLYMIGCSYLQCSS